MRSKKWSLLPLKLPLRRRAALVAEARYGKGLFLWTQFFSPEVIWNQYRDFAQRFLQNLLTYSLKFREKKIIKARLEARPWALVAGRTVRMKVRCASKVADVRVEVLTPRGTRQRISGTEYVPREGGTYQARARITADDGRHNS